MAKSMKAVLVLDEGNGKTSKKTITNVYAQATDEDISGMLEDFGSLQEKPVLELQIVETRTKVPTASA